MNNFELLESAGFKKFQSSEVPFPWWINVASNMAFKFEAVEDADFHWLADRIRGQAESGDFLFYFAYGTTMDAGLCDQILVRLGKDDLTPVVQRIFPAQ
ncbi:MAG: hypothetical protein ACRD19_08770 [Terriglobia bacterium]